MLGSRKILSRKIAFGWLVKDGTYFEPYLPQGEYAELSKLANTRENVIRRSNAVKNTITAVLDEYLPEICSVWKKPLKNKAARQILRSCPFPAFILKTVETRVLSEIEEGGQENRRRQED
ncbi:MAG: hypothetical protein LBK41_06405 [Clostridiales bacterium]|nr:hypothetical protein [Clostridiales bacterium]